MKTASPPPKGFKALRRAGWTAAAALFLLFAYRVVTGCLVTRYDRAIPRDPETRVMPGAEPRDLGPVDAPRAALLVHGFAGGGNNFADLPERLAGQGWRVRVMRLPGHGTSVRDFEKQTPDELFTAVLDELRRLRERHETVILVGHSMGAALGVLAAAQERVDGLVLGAPYFGVTYYWYYVFTPETWIRVARPVVRWVYKGKLFLQVNRKEAKDAILTYAWLPTRASLTLAQIGDRANKPGILGKVTCPVLMIHAHGDVAASPKAAEEAFDAITSEEKRLVWLERSNHQIFWDYDRGRVTAEVLAFAKDRGPATPQASP